MSCPRALVLVAGAVLVTACTACTPKGSGQSPSGSDTTITQHVTETTHPRPTFTPTALPTVAPLVPGAQPGSDAVEKPCPYIASSQVHGPQSMAALEGDRIYRTTVLTGTKPVGCRFYFWAPPYEATAEISVRTFASSLEAHNAMVLTGEAGTQVEGKKAIVPGVDAVLYRTRFYGPDGARDWACVFAAGKLMVTVRTQRKDTSLNALLIAQALAPKF